MNEALVARCENRQNFLYHFALNLALLPSSLQTAEDVAKVRGILGDTAEPHSVRSAAYFLFHRRNKSEPLRIDVLIEHLNSLTDADHEEFVRILFCNRDDFSDRDWRQRINKTVEGVLSRLTEQVTIASAEALAFQLHLVCFADWWRQEEFGLYLAKSTDQNVQKAVALADQASAECVRDLIAGFKLPWSKQ